ncbi:hypothetical protein V4S31_04655 [Enterococcus cecorum]
MSGVRYEFQKKKTGFVVCFYRNKMSTVHDAYDMLEDGDKKPIKNHQAYSKNDRLTIEQERIAKIIDYINVHGEITNREARELLGLVRFYYKAIFTTNGSAVLASGLRNTQND